MLDRVVEFFRGQPGVVGMSVAGSVARRVADEHSDLDVDVFFADPAARERVWSERWEWDIAPWFHRFDADHVRSHFVIYLFEPGIKTDIPLLLVSDPPTPAGAPYEVLWDETGDVTRWVEASNSGRVELPPDWSEAAHEDERLWAWAYYCILHIRRGEYYDVAYDFHMLRNIVETWLPAPRARVAQTRTAEAYRGARSAARAHRRSRVENLAGGTRADSQLDRGVVGWTREDLRRSG